MDTHSPRLEQIANVFSGHYERGAGKDDPAGTHRLVFIGSIDSRPGHALLHDRCPRFTPGKDPKQSILRSGDLVIPARGDRHDVALIDQALDRRPLIAASFLHVIRPDPDSVDAGYLNWWFNQSATQAKLREFVRGTKIPFLPLKATRSLKVPLPPLPVQRRIAEFHSLVIREAELTDKIKSLRLELNNAYANKIATGAYEA